MSRFRGTCDTTRGGDDEGLAAGVGVGRGVATQCSRDLGREGEGQGAPLHTGYAASVGSFCVFCVGSSGPRLATCKRNQRQHTQKHGPTNTDTDADLLCFAQPARLIRLRHGQRAWCRRCHRHVKATLSEAHSGTAPTPARAMHLTCTALAWAQSRACRGTACTAPPAVQASPW